MDLFPIGEIANSQSYGSMDSLHYYMFEPNNGSTSQPTYDILVTSFQQQTKVTREKSKPHISLVYKYENIFQREYQQIEHFVDYKEEALNSFYAVDWSRGRKPTSVTLSGDDWLVGIDNTRLFSTVSNKKSDYAFLWNGRNWKMGDITAITAASDLTVDVAYGDLTSTDANSSAYVYPVYCVYFSPGVLSGFESTSYIDEYINQSDDGGWMKTGDITFVSKYSV